MKNIHKIIIIFLISFFYSFNLHALTSAQVLQKSTNALNSASGISATFKMTSAYGSSSGTYKAKGKKFCYLSATSSTWYDGKNMWVSNVGSKETTLMIPNPDELREANPVDYIKIYSSQYNTSFINQTDKSKYVLKLQPKSNKKSLPSLELTVNANNFKPQKIKIIQKGTKPIEIWLYNVNYNAKLFETDFKYPKSKYPGYDIVDLR